MVNRARRIGVLFFLLTVGLSALGQQQKSLDRFNSDLDSLRNVLGIPGMAVALKEGNTMLLEKGFGYADIKNKIAVTPATSFRVASITKTFTSTILMQLVEKGKLSLDSPITAYGVDLGNPSIMVRHLVTHTSEGEPGTHFQYNGYRYGQLGPVIEKASGIPFFRLLMENIIKPSRMNSSAPGISVLSYFNYIKERKDMRPYFENAFGRLAKPYAVNNEGEIVETSYIDEFGAFGGLTTTVEDLLKYSAAIDSNRFVKYSTQQTIFTPNRTNNGGLTPYGLGWFTQEWMGVNYYWHYGQTQGESGLFIKVPSRKLTLVVLTNSDRLSSPFPLGDGDLFMSPVGLLFFKYIINKDKNFLPIDYKLSISKISQLLQQNQGTAYKDFYNKELIVQAILSNIQKDTSRATDLYNLYGHLNFIQSDPMPKEEIIASIERAGINQTISKDFTIDHPLKLRIHGVGENCSSDFKAWCDYGWIEDNTGKIIWEMQGQPATHAGGAIKNQRVDTTIDLPAGTYKLRYKSDWGHAYNYWDSLPPDNFFWGIILSK